MADRLFKFADNATIKANANKKGYKVDLARSIRVAAAIKGYTPTQVAKGVGVSLPQVSQWRSSGLISLRNIEKLAVYFEMPVSEFIKLGEDN